MDEIHEEIRSLHSRRIFSMKQRMRLLGAVGATIRCSQGWSPPGTDRFDAKTNAAAVKTAADLLQCGRKLQAGKGHPLAGSELFKEWERDIMTTLKAASMFEEEEELHEKDAAKLVEQLPLWKSFGEEIRGFGPSSLATIIGEVGNPASYRNEACLWKRLGIAVVDGKAQGKPGKGADAETWIEHGYNKARRSRMFVIGDNLIRAGNPKYRTYYNERKELEAEKAKAAGKQVAPSAKIPAKRKAEFISEGHIHLRAHRRMEQVFIRNLYRAAVRLAA